MLKRKSVILANVEPSYQGAVALTGADAVLVENLSYSFNHRMQEQNPVGPTLNNAKEMIYGGGLMTVTFEVKIKGSGTAGTAPEVGPLLRMCGHSETIVPVTSVAYSPVSSSTESGKIEIYEDGTKYTLTGCAGTSEFNCPVGEAGVISFSITGHYAKSDAAVASPTYDSTVPAPFINAAFSVDSYSAVIAALQISGGQSVITPPAPQNADGYGTIEIASRNVTGSIDPEATLVATYDWLGKLESGATFTIDTGVVGGTAGNRWRVQTAKTQYSEHGSGDRDGKVTYQQGLKLLESSGDDEYTLTFT